MNLLHKTPRDYEMTSCYVAKRYLGDSQMPSRINCCGA
jgi:hypothetical protein